MAGVPAASFFPSSCPGSAACSQPELAVPSPPPASGGGGPIPQPSPGGLSLASGSSLWDFPPPVWTLTGHSRSRCPCPQSQAAAPSRWGCSPVVLHLGCPLLASAVPLTLLGPKSALRPPCPGRGPLPPRALRATGSEMPLPTATVPSWRGGGASHLGQVVGVPRSWPRPWRGRTAQAAPAPGSAPVSAGTSRTRCCWTGRSSTCAPTCSSPAPCPTWSSLAMATLALPSASTTLIPETSLAT